MTKRKQDVEDYVATPHDRVLDGQQLLELCAYTRTDLNHHVVIETIGDGL